MYRWCFVFSAVLTTSAYAVASESMDTLLAMSLEELSMLDVQLETASKFPQQLSDIPASVYVLDSERIKRSGVRTIPEALSLVPGVNVSKFNDSEFFVSSRGFHDGLYNKMLVMIDGRSLFSPVYGGVYWSDVDYVLEDIDRIEVLRGPGGAIWGGNAVNGVIHIITRSTDETQGSYVEGTFAKSGNYNASVRQGIRFNEEVSGRAFYKISEQQIYRETKDPKVTKHTAGAVIQNNVSQTEWSFRFGGERSEFEQFQWTERYDDYGEWYDYSERQADVKSHSAYAQLSVNKNITSDLTSAYQLSLQTNSEDALDAPGKYNVIELDASFLHQVSDGHALTYGGGYQLIEIEFGREVSELDFSNIDYYVRASSTAREVDSVIDIFVQSQYQWNDKFHSVIGVKAEYFEHTYALEFSPQIRGVYQIDQRNSAWAGIARAVTSPSYMDTKTAYIYNYYDDSGSTTIATLPNEVIGLESVVTAEVGYRYIGDKLEFDSTIFYSEHKNVRGEDYVGYSDEYLNLELYRLNDDYQLDTYGVEIGTRFKLASNYQLYVNYSYFTAEQQKTSGQATATDTAWYSIDYQHLASLQSLWDITAQWQFDLTLKGQSIQYGDSVDQIPNVLALDARLAWQKNRHAPLFEAIMQNVGESEGYVTDIGQLYNSHYNEQVAYLRVSHAF